MRGDGDRHGGVDTRELLDGDRVRKGVRPRPAVGLRQRDAHEPELGEPVHDVVREAVLVVELLRDGPHALLGKGANRRAEQLALLADVEIHQASRSASAAISRTPNPVEPLLV